MFIERVLPGHPDKIADTVADSLVDYCLAQDPNAKCAFEVLINNKDLFVAGESSMQLNESKISEYLDSFLEENSLTLSVNKQSQSIVNNRKEGAGDQSVVWGMANADNSFYLPNALVNSETILAQITNMVVLKYPGSELDGKLLLNPLNPQLLSVSVGGDFDQKKFLKELTEKAHKLYPNIAVKLNPPNQNSWKGGVQSDSGVTGRKIINDTYGPYLPHGGGAFSGKDLTKVDRTGAYLARELSIAVLNQYDLDEFKLGLCYEMGGLEPVNFTFEFRTKEYEIKSEVLSRCISEDLARFFKGEKFSDTVDRYMDSYQRNIWKFKDLARSVRGHMFNSDVPWNKNKSLGEYR